MIEVARCNLGYAFGQLAYGRCLELTPGCEGQRAELVGHRVGDFCHAVADGGDAANTAGGVNSNILSGKSPEDFERLAGMSILNGIPVRIAPATDELKEDA